MIINPSENRNVMSAAFGVTSIVSLHLGALIGTLNRCYFKLNDFITDTIVIIIFIAISIFNYILFERKNRYIEIVKIFEGESKTKSILGGAALVIYLIAFIILMVKRW